jgi:hypothetical protein
MNANFHRQTSDEAVPASAGISERQSRLPARGRLRIAGAFLVAATCAGCATSNYDFDALSDASDDSRVERLSRDWDVENEGGKDDGLYDISVLPLAHTSLNVFAESDEEGIPEGFVEADIDAYLPLFGILDVCIKRYDNDRRMYEQQDYNSYLWGLFQTHRELIDTEVGLREKKRGRFLWFFGWSSSPKYADQAGEVSSE